MPARRQPSKQGEHLHQVFTFDVLNFFLKNTCWVLQVTTFQDNGGGFITCSGYDLKAISNCKQVVKGLNEIEGVNGIECFYGIANDFLFVENWRRDCNQVANSLNGIDGVTGIECGYLGDDYGVLQVKGYATATCETTARALSTFVADKVEGAIFKQFFGAAVPITAMVSLGSGYYAYNNLGGDTDLKNTVYFGLFVGLRVFDFMSDWGMYGISLAGQHKGTPLRRACLVFSIIGSIMLIVDMKTMRERADQWFGVAGAAEAATSIGYGMLAVVFLEDVPQMGITIAFLDDVGSTVGRSVDGIAVASLIFSIASMISNGFMAFKLLSSGGGPTFGAAAAI